MKNKLFPIIGFVVAVCLLGGLIGLIQMNKNKAAANTFVEVTTQNFEDEVLKHTGPVFIEFYVDKNCAPCEKQAPVLEKVAKDYAGKVKFVRVHATNQMPISAAVGIPGVPTHIMFNPSTSTGSAAAGFLDEADLRKFIDDALAPAPTPAPAPAPTQP